MNPFKFSMQGNLRGRVKREMFPRGLTHSASVPAHLTGISPLTALSRARSFTPSFLLSISTCPSFRLCCLSSLFEVKQTNKNNIQVIPSATPPSRPARVLDGNEKRVCVLSGCSLLEPTAVASSSLLISFPLPDHLQTPDAVPSLFLVLLLVSST